MLPAVDHSQTFDSRLKSNKWVLCLKKKKMNQFQMSVITEPRKL